MNSEGFAKKIGCEFTELSLLETALTHSSYCHEGRQIGLKDNERLEFLGDSVFNTVIGEHLYRRAADIEEGRLTKLRAQIVCEASLDECGNRFDIGKYLNLGHGEELSGGRTRASIIADATEAVIGAIFLDGGWEKARDFILTAFAPTIEKALDGKIHTDFKTEIQERLQSKGGKEIFYRIDREEGPDHQKTFYVSLWFEGSKLGEGFGRSKKEAEQNAAKAALEG